MGNDMSRPVLILLWQADAPTPPEPESEDDANMLQTSAQDPVATDNEMEENGLDRDVQPDLDEPGRQNSNAGLKLLHPSELIAELCGPRQETSSFKLN